MSADAGVPGTVETAATRDLERLLDLASAQPEQADAEAEGRVAALVDALSSVAEGAHRLHAEVDAAAGPARTEALEAAVNRAIIQLQFYDRLSQRLGNARATLHACREVLDAGSVGQTPPSLRAVCDRLLARCAIAADQVLVEAVGRGDPIDAALARLEVTEARGAEQDPELF